MTSATGPCRAEKRLSGKVVFTLAVSLFVLTGCGLTDEQAYLLGGILGATAVGGQAPSHEIEQTYYLGVFDPQEQLPPQMYRIRVNGQASFISNTNFASGWVPAALVDSLGAGIRLDQEKGSVQFDKVEDEFVSEIKTGRRLIMFGPEGFREAPANHRLVIVMGSDPSNFFSAIDNTLGTVAQVMDEQRAASLSNELFATLNQVRAEKDRLNDLKSDIADERLRVERELQR